MAIKSVAAKVRVALAKAAPEAESDHLDRFATSIAATGALWKGAGLVMSKRGTVPALKALERMDELVMSLAAALDTVGPDERLALRGRIDSMWRLLAGFKNQLEAGHAALKKAAPVPTRTSKPRKDEAQAIARQCAGAYGALTGSKATVRTRDGVAYGPFLDLVRGVFLALNLDAKPELFARRAAKDASL